MSNAQKRAVRFQKNARNERIARDLEQMLRLTEQENKNRAARAMVIREIGGKNATRRNTQKQYRGFKACFTCAVCGKYILDE